MRALDRAQAFVVTCNGAPVRALTPRRSRRFVAAEAALAAFAVARRSRPTRSALTWTRSSTTIRRLVGWAGSQAPARG
jgi:hypothetical protein